MLRKLRFKGWDAVCLSTEKIQLIAPLDIGPRIVSLLRPDGGDNLFFEVTEELGGSGEEGFRMRGGHRLWHAPEHPVRTYQPDNRPPQYKELGNGRGFSLDQSVEEKTGIQKSMTVEIVNERSVRLTHGITNRGLWRIETAAWALTVMRGGGQSILPLPPKGEHPRDLLPTFSIVPWDYADLSMPAWKFFPGFIRVEIPKVTCPQKLGVTDYPGWSAYWLDGDLFVKHATVQKGATYPDRGCPVETFADSDLTELETLGPLSSLEPGDGVTHVESWGLLAGMPAPSSEEVFQDVIRPAVEQWVSGLEREVPDEPDDVPQPVAGVRA